MIVRNGHRPLSAERALPFTRRRQYRDLPCLACNCRRLATACQQKWPDGLALNPATLRMWTKRGEIDSGLLLDSHHAKE